MKFLIALIVMVVIVSVMADDHGHNKGHDSHEHGHSSVHDSHGNSGPAKHDSHENHGQSSHGKQQQNDHHDGHSGHH